jgi:DNA polymerase/3'-5' exonuclease PolX
MTQTVDSASDDRTANNAVRHTYRVLSDAEKQQMVELKDIGAAFIAKCQEIGGSRELSLAITNAEQAVMWAVKHVTR